MKRKTAILCYLAFLPIALPAQSADVNTRSFDHVRIVELRASGDCEIARSSDARVTIELTYSYPDDQIVYAYDQEGDQLIISQKYHAPSVRNDSRWKILVPDNATVKIISGKGKLRIGRVSAEVEANTGAGNITVDGATGTFRLSTGNGSIVVQDTQFSGPSTLTSSRGEVELILKKKLDNDLKVSTGSGDVQLSLRGIAFDGTLVAQVNKKRGRVRVPFAKPTVEEKAENRDVIVTSTYVVGSRSPRITLSSGEGNVVIKPE